MRSRANFLGVVTALGVAMACSGKTDSDGKHPDSMGGGAGTPATVSGTSGNGAAGLGGAAGFAAAGGVPAGSAGATTGGVAGGGNAGMAAAGVAGIPLAGLGGAAGLGGSMTAGESGAPEAGSGGAPIELGPPGPDGFAIKVVLASDIKPSAPTTVGIVQWDLEEEPLVEAHIEFGLDQSYGMTAPVSLEEPGYRTVLVGMKPAKTYHFRIVAEGSKTYTSDDHTLTTGAPYATPLIADFSVKLPSELDPGFFVTSFWSVASDSGNLWTTFIVDTDGEVVWWYTPADKRDSAERGFARVRLSANSRDVWLAQVTNTGAPLLRVSIDTLEEQTYRDTRGSHDIAAVSGDTMAYLDYGETDCDSIFEIDKTGATTEVFEATGITNDGTMRDTCHGNSVRYSKKEDVYVYSDDYHDVVVVGRDGSLKWKLAEKVSGGQESWGGFQHGTHLLDNSLLIYANRGGGEQNAAAAIEFGLDGSVLRKFTSRGGQDFLGDVQRLPSGNTMIDYGYGLQVVDPSDKVVLEMHGTEAGFGYAEFRKSLYGEPLDIDE